MTIRSPLHKATLWMTGWLLLMVIIAVAGREALRELSVFQVMELRSLIGTLMLWPLVYAAGGLRANGSYSDSVHRPVWHCLKKLKECNNWQNCKLSVTVIRNCISIWN